MLINVTELFPRPQGLRAPGGEDRSRARARQTPDRPLRIWEAGCSTGEETYSIAMLFPRGDRGGEADVKLQVFASDVDGDAVAIARNGLYPESIAADVSPARLARFFTKEDHGYRVTPELRGPWCSRPRICLADAPFSRLDLVSCRNLLIYLRPEAQEKVLSLFHFALREGGILFLGASETVADFGDRFEPISKTQRIYRHIGRSRPGGGHFPLGARADARLPLPGGRRALRRRQSAAT